jgi:hypothetical protein
MKINGTELIIVGVIALLAFYYINTQATASADAAAAASTSAGSDLGLDSVISSGLNFASDFS